MKRKNKNMEPEDNYKANRLVLILIIGILCITAVVITVVVQVNHKTTLQAHCSVDNIEYKQVETCWLNTSFAKENCPLPHDMQCEFSGDVNPTLLMHLR